MLSTAFMCLSLALYRSTHHAHWLNDDEAFVSKLFSVKFLYLELCIVQKKI